MTYETCYTSFSVSCYIGCAMTLHSRYRVSINKGFRRRCTDDLSYIYYFLFDVCYCVIWAHLYTESELRAADDMRPTRLYLRLYVSPPKINRLPLRADKQHLLTAISYRRHDMHHYDTYFATIALRTERRFILRLRLHLFSGYGMRMYNGMASQLYRWRLYRIEEAALHGNTAARRWYSASFLSDIAFTLRRHYFGLHGLSVAIIK